MDIWFESEIRMRREDALQNAQRNRLSRLARSGRSFSIRSRIADGAQVVSDAFAVVARTLRDTERA